METESLVRDLFRANNDIFIPHMRGELATPFSHALAAMFKKYGNCIYDPVEKCVFEFAENDSLLKVVLVSFEYYESIIPEKLFLKLLKKLMREHPNKDVRYDAVDYLPERNQRSFLRSIYKNETDGFVREEIAFSVLECDMNDELHACGFKKDSCFTLYNMVNAKSRFKDDVDRQIKETGVEMTIKLLRLVFNDTIMPEYTKQKMAAYASDCGVREIESINFLRV